MLEVSNLEILKKLVSMSCVAGNEFEVISYIKNLLADVCNFHSTDSMNNLILFKEGSGKNKKKVLVTSHIDEIGLIVSHIDNDGFIRFIPIGGIDPDTIVASKVTINGKKQILGVVGSTPIHAMTPEMKSKAIKIDDLFIDSGLSKKELSEVVSIGDTITKNTDFVVFGDKFCGKALDNRLGAFVVISSIMSLKNNYHDIYFAFTSQEEVGLRGARVAANIVKPDIGINVDIGLACDIPGISEDKKMLKLGAGPGIKISDRSHLGDRRLLKRISEIASNSNIQFQHYASIKGGTDTAAVQHLSGHGTVVAALSVPIRYAHTSVEMGSFSDTEKSIALLSEILSNELAINTIN